MRDMWADFSLRAHDRAEVDVSDPPPVVEHVPCTIQQAGPNYRKVFRVVGPAMLVHFDSAALKGQGAGGFLAWLPDGRVWAAEALAQICREERWGVKFVGNSKLIVDFCVSSARPSKPNLFATLA